MEAGLLMCRRMLSDIEPIAHSGRIGEEVLARNTIRFELIEFIRTELPKWRDDPERPMEHAETVLTSQLCSHMNSVSRISEAWHRIQFGTEIRDENNKRGTIDFAPKPCSVVLIIEGRKYTHFDMIFPIECKRLPTPAGTKRDEKEYVIVDSGSTGGIQRFKFGFHASDHDFGAMIAYVQDAIGFSRWLTRINGWVHDLGQATDSVWCDEDRLELLEEDTDNRVCSLKSNHHRQNGLDDIELRHLWIDMN